jgi:hypothetical protein
VDGLTVTVEFTIRTGICVVTEPAVAVMVAVRLFLLAEPDEKVRVPVPVAPVVTEPAERIPESALMFTITLGTTAFPLSTAVTVIEEVFELSDLTVVGEADISSRVATGGTLLAGVDDEAILPVVSLQPARTTIAAAHRNIAANLVTF